MNAYLDIGNSTTKIYMIAEKPYKYRWDNRKFEDGLKEIISDIYIDNLYVVSTNAKYLKRLKEWCNKRHIQVFGINKYKLIDELDILDPSINSNQIGMDILLSGAYCKLNNIHSQIIYSFGSGYTATLIHDMKIKNIAIFPGTMNIYSTWSQVYNLDYQLHKWSTSLGVDNTSAIALGNWCAFMGLIANFYNLNKKYSDGVIICGNDTPYNDEEIQAIFDCNVSRNTYLVVQTLQQIVEKFGACDDLFIKLTN